MLDIVELSRLQFALAAVYRFLFVSLTLGMTFLLAIMEMVYTLSDKQIYKDITKFWGKLFGINLALGVTTGPIMEFQFGANWSCYSHYVGNILGAPLATEGLMASFLEPTLVGLSFFGWDRLGKVQHMYVAWLMALDSNLSVLWVSIANSWMQNPTISDFSFETMRMEVVGFSELVLNPVAQVEFVHTVASGYVTGTIFIFGANTWYILKGRDFVFAKRSSAIVANFGIAVVPSVIVLSDESGYEMGGVQKIKPTAIGTERETQPAPVAFALFGTPNQGEETSRFAIQILYALGITATRSMDTPVIGLKELMVQHEGRIRNGMKAYSLLEQLRSGSTDRAVRNQFNSMKKDLGYGLLLKRYMSNVADAIGAQIQQATKDSISRVAPLYFALRIMVACGFLFLVVVAFSFWGVVHSRTGEKKWFPRAALYGIPLPWIVVEAGWFVAEYGRQPWAIGEVLLIAATNSSLTADDLILPMALTCGLYTLFLVAKLFSMFELARLGPSSLKTGCYHLEQPSTTTQPVC